MIFDYKAIDAGGLKISSSIDADSSKEVSRILIEQKYTVISIKAGKKTAGISAKLFNSKLSINDIVTFVRQLSSLIHASIPIDESLRTIMQDTDNKSLNKTVSYIYSEVVGGSALHSALEKTGAFDDYFIASVKSGEQGSSLAEVLETLSVEIEKQYKFKKKITAALSYPLVVMFVAVTVIGSLLVFVVPQITSVFENNNQELPPLTIAVIGVSDFIAKNIIAIIIIIILSIIIIKIALKQEVIQLVWHKLLAKIPVIGRLIIIANASRFSRTLALLHNSGSPIIDSLTYSLNVVKFLPMKKSIQNSTQNIREGSSIYHAFKLNNALPSMMLYMIASGEKSSNLGKMLNKAADSSEYELDNSMQKIISVFEPLMILIMGGVVLLIVMAILLPIFEMNNAVL